MSAEMFVREVAIAPSGVWSSEDVFTHRMPGGYSSPIVKKEHEAWERYKTDSMQTGDENDCS